MLPLPATMGSKGSVFRIPGRLNIGMIHKSTVAGRGAPQYLYMYGSIYLSIYLPTYLSIDWSIYLSIYRLIDLSIYRLIDLSIYLSIYLSIFAMFTWYILPIKTTSYMLSLLGRLGLFSGAIFMGRIHIFCCRIHGWYNGILSIHLPYKKNNEKTLVNIPSSHGSLTNPWDWNMYLHWSHKNQPFIVGKYTIHRSYG